MKQIMHNVWVGSSPVCELLGSMFLAQSYEKLLPTNPRDELYFPAELHKWVENTRRAMSDQVKKEMEIYFNYESYLGLGLFQLIWQTQTYHSIPAFLKMLEQLPARELLQQFIQTGYNQGSPDISDPAEVIRFIKQKSLPEVEKWKLLYLYADAENTKKNFIHLLHHFYHHHFPQDQSRILELQSEHMRELEEELKENAKEKLDRLLSHHYAMLEGESQIILFPTYFGATHSSTSYFTKQKLFIYMYGIGYAQMALHQAMNEERLIEAFKALSDETRIKIIKILNSTPCYGYELAQALQLSNSTISHHLAQLSSFGFIKARKEENKNYYEVNKELIHSMMGKMADFLTG